MFEQQDVRSVCIFMPGLATIFHHLQRQLFPALTAELGSLRALDQHICEVIALSDLGRFTRRCELRQRLPTLSAHLAGARFHRQARLSVPPSALVDALKSRPLLRQLCGWESPGEIPREATINRAFAEFTDDQLPQQIRAHMIKTHAEPKLVGHVSRDATAIEAPARLAAKPTPVVPAAIRKRGRPIRKNA